MKRAALLLLLLGPACADDAAGPTSTGAGQLVWDPAGGQLGVFPDDAFAVADATTRTGIRLHVDPAAVPEVAKLTPNLRDVFADLNSLDGFGVTAGLTLRFDQAIDPATLVSGMATADWASPIVLVTLDAGGPTLHAFEVQTVVDGNTAVILEPMAPLPPKTQAFIAITTKVHDAAGRPLERGAMMHKALTGVATGAASTDWVAPRMKAAAELVAAHGVAVADVAGAVVFTTESIHEEAVAIAADVAARQIHAAAGTTCSVESRWRRCEGSFVAVDYRGAAGVLANPATPTTPDTSTTYTLKFTAWLPLTLPGPHGGAAPPTIIFGHGLGGDRSQGAGIAQTAAPDGIATVAIDAVHQGQHPTTAAGGSGVPVLDFFAINPAGLTFEPLQLRENFRQSTFDQLQLVRMIELGLDLDGDQVPDLDKDRMMYMGHSLGGIMGPALLALAPRLQAGVLVAAGGRVANIVRDSAQFAPLIQLVRPPDTSDGEVARFFPVIQTLVDRGDSAAWSPQLLDASRRPAGFPAAAPHILFEMVIGDATVPNTSNRALARSLDITQVPPVLQEIGMVAVSGAAPIMSNLTDGRTAGLLQFDHIEGGSAATHNNITNSRVGMEGWVTFIDSWLTTGHPVIVNPYQVLGI